MILAQPESKQAIEAYRELVDDMDFAWVPAHIKRQEIKSEIREYQAKLKNLRALDPANADVQKRAIADLPVLRAEIIKKLSIFLHNNRRPANPLSSRLDRLIEFLPAIYIDADMIAEAVSLMPITEGCMPVEEKRKKISSLEKLVEKKKGELEKASPPDHFQWINGAPTMDLCDNFEKKWRSAQARLNAPSDALGHELSSCKETEQQAWRDLRIRSAMSPNSKVAPIPA
jgi:hypothetical protein